MNHRILICAGVFGLVAVSGGCTTGAEGKAEASTGASGKPASATAAAPVAKASRIQELLGVTSSEAAPAAPSPFSKASMNGPAGWNVEPSDDLWAALDTQVAKAISASCYMTNRLQPGGDPMSGIKLWASSAGGKPASFKGPEAIELGPDKVAVDLYVGQGGSVDLGGSPKPGVTLAMIPKAQRSLLIVGVVRAEANEATKKKLAGCLESFKLKK